MFNFRCENLNVCLFVLDFFKKINIKKSAKKPNQPPSSGRRRGLLRKCLITHDFQISYFHCAHTHELGNSAIPDKVLNRI